MTDTANITFDLSPDERDAILDTLIGLRSPKPEPQAEATAPGVAVWQGVAPGPLWPCCPGWRVASVAMNYEDAIFPIAIRVIHHRDCPHAQARMQGLPDGMTLCGAPTRTTNRPCTQHVPVGELCRHHRPSGAAT